MPRVLCTHLAEIRLDPVVLDLLLCQSRPELGLHLFLAQDQDDGARGDALLGLFRDDLVVEFNVEFVLSFGDAFGGAAGRRRLADGSESILILCGGMRDEEGGIVD